MSSLDRQWRFSEVLLPVSGAARRARDLITEACLRWQVPQLLAPASLVVTELVTNAVQHARTMIDLQARCDRRDVVIEVGDGSCAVPLMPAAWVVSARCYDPGLSRGLLLVDTTVDRWAYRYVSGGKVVWAALGHSA